MGEINRIPTWPGWNTVEMIGQGSFGAVYKIERTMFGEIETAALKMISIPKSRSEISDLRSFGEDTESISRTFQKQTESFLGEYRLMKQLSDCPNVVRVDDVICVQQDDGIGWDILIRMELLTTLAVSLGSDRNTPEETVRRLGRDICKALTECEKLHIIHRDIKPQNIFVSQSGLYKLGDFGIARIKEQAATATARIGTYNYMAPEVYYGKHYGSAADIYSLGIVLYWLLNERRIPFTESATAADREEALFRRLNGEKIPEPASGSKELKRIVLKACAYDPEERYRSAADMLRDLENLDKAVNPEKDSRSADLLSDPEEIDEIRPIKDLPMSAEEEETMLAPHLPAAEQKSGSETAGAASKKKKMPVALIAALLAFAVLGVAWLARSSRREPAPAAEAGETTEASAAGVPTPEPAASENNAPTQGETALTGETEPEWVAVFPETSGNDVQILSYRYLGGPAVDRIEFYSWGGENGGCEFELYYVENEQVIDVCPAVYSGGPLSDEDIELYRPFAVRDIRDRDIPVRVRSPLTVSYGPILAENMTTQDNSDFLLWFGFSADREIISTMIIEVGVPVEK